MTCGSYTPAGSAAPTCSVELQKLYVAYTSIVAGKGVQRVRGADYREVEYHAANLPELVKMYGFWYDQCGAESGLPDLRDIMGGSSVKRGGPGIIGGCH